MKKVLFVITKSNWGGAQRYVYDLATALPKEGWGVAVALGGTGEPDATVGTLDAKLRAAGVETFLVSSFMRDLSLRKEWRAFKELGALYRKYQPEVVHLNSSKAGGVGALAAVLGNIPRVVFTIHGLPYDEERNFLWRTFAWAGTWMTCLLADEVITVSKNNFKRARRLPFCRKKIHLVHTGVEEIDFLERSVARAALRERCPELPEEALWIGAIGELHWNKGFHHLVRATSYVKRKGVDAATVIIGEGTERDFLETLAEEERVEDRMHLAGFLPEAARYLHAFDVFALPSVKEGLPYVLLEAGLAGQAVAASKLGGIPDVIGNDVSGLLHPPSSAAALGDNLTALANDSALRKKLGQNLQQRVRSEFTIEQMVQKTLALYTA